MVNDIIINIIIIIIIITELFICSFMRLQILRTNYVQCISYTQQP